MVGMPCAATFPSGDAVELHYRKHESPPNGGLSLPIYRMLSGGGTVGYRAAWTSVRAKVLVDGLCICSRMGAALLNGGSSRRRPQKPGRGRRALRAFGFRPEDAGSDLLPRGSVGRIPCSIAMGQKHREWRSPDFARPATADRVPAQAAALSLVDGIASSTPRSACGSRRHMYPVSYRTAILDRLGSFQ